MRVLFILKRKLMLLLLPGSLMLAVIIGYDLVTHGDISGKIIVVDAGHGGIDPGANRPGVREKDINLAIAMHLKETLNQYGAKVILSRESDVELSPECDNDMIRGRYHRDLTARVELVEESDADLFVSIHANAVADRSRRGAVVFYHSSSDAGKVLANAILVELRKLTSASKDANAANYFVLRKNKIPAALVEVGYITNADERLLLQTAEYQQKLAEAIAEGIGRYYQLSFFRLAQDL